MTRPVSPRLVKDPAGHLRRPSSTWAAPAGRQRHFYPCHTRALHPLGLAFHAALHRWGWCGDAASAVDMGQVRPRRGFDSLGTSDMVFVSSAAFEPTPVRAVHAFQHALPDRWHQKSGMLGAARAVTWVAHIRGLDDDAAPLAGAPYLSKAEQFESPLYLPYLSGKRSPHNNPLATGAWRWRAQPCSRTTRHTPPAMPT